MKKIGIVGLAALTLLAGCGKVTDTNTVVVNTTTGSTVSSISGSLLSSNMSGDLVNTNSSNISTSNSGSEVVLNDSSISSYETSSNNNTNISSENSSIDTNSASSVSVVLKNYEVVNNGRVYSLKIPQANLAINVPSSIANDTYYKILPATTGNGRIIYVYPKSLAEKYSACANGEYGIAITKIPGTAPADLKGAKQLNGFYVTASAPNGSCSDNKYEKDFTNALLNNFGSISQI